MTARVDHTYCTYFDSAFLSRGIAMLRSLQRYDPGFPIVVLALDPLCSRVIREVVAPEIQVVELDTLHAYCPELLSVREGRTTWEFYATHKPVFAQYVLERNPSPASLMFVDSDTWFFSDPSPMFDEIAGAPIALSPHRFSAAHPQLAVHGLYNAGCVYWRSGEVARRALADWRRDCFEWCHERPGPNGLYMNQGYLNRWPDRYQGVHIIQHPGVNLAPWNLNNHRLEQRSGGVRVDGQPVIFFHFSGLTRNAKGKWHSIQHVPGERGSKIISAAEALYLPYLAAVEAERQLLLGAYGIEGTATVRPMTEQGSVVQRIKSVVSAWTSKSFSST